jgi:hypothetical protein
MGLELMILTRFPRSVWETANNRRACDIPNVMNRSSLPEWSGSGKVTASLSPNTDAAS